MQNQTFHAKLIFAQKAEDAAKSNTVAQFVTDLLIAILIFGTPSKIRIVCINFLFQMPNPYILYCVVLFYHVPTYPYQQ